MTAARAVIRSAVKFSVALIGSPPAAGWGAWGRLQRAATVEKALTAHGARLWALGTTKAGHPRHPLYLPAVAPLQPYEPGGVAR